MGPMAPVREPWFYYMGRRFIFFFPKPGHPDWNRGRPQESNWPKPPLLFYKDEPSQQYANAFDGLYAWVHPSKNWTPDGSDWGEEYLENFYKKMKTKYPDKIPVGGAWPGFNDARASWGLNRHIDQRCGKTFEDKLGLFRRCYEKFIP